MEAKEEKINRECILKAGYLYKKSQHIGSWRKRWIVVTSENILSYKSEKMDGDPTEIAKVKNIKIGSISDVIMSIGSNQVIYKLKAITETQKTEWMDFINRLKFGCIAMPVIVQCSNSKYDDQFCMIIPFDDNYKYNINTLISDTIRHLNNKYHPKSFCIVKISSASFIGVDIAYNQWKQLDENITTYNQTIIEQEGLFITIVDEDEWKRKCIDVPVVIKCKSKSSIKMHWRQCGYDEAFSEKLSNQTMTVYHATTQKNADSILKNGFRMTGSDEGPERGMKLGAAIYFGTDEKYCREEAANSACEIWKENGRKGKRIFGKDLAVIKAEIDLRNVFDIGKYNDSEFNKKVGISRDEYDWFTERLTNEFLQEFGCDTIVMNMDSETAEVAIYDSGQVRKCCLI